MTSSAESVLEKIKDLPIFNGELYFAGGTALSYYINHRISEDIDIVSPMPLDCKKIIPALTMLGAKKIDDENSIALKLAGLFADKFILKFALDGVKIEFFQANRPAQKEILSDIAPISYKDSKLKLLDLKSIAKLKLVALLQRDKARDLFDFSSIIIQEILSLDEILKITKSTKNICSKDELIKFLFAKKEAKDDEAVYMDEQNRLELTFGEIRQSAISSLKAYDIT